MEFIVHIRNEVIKTDTPHKFKQYLRTLEGKKCVLNLEKYKVGRTLQQLRYLWGIIYPLISDTTGYECNELHEIMKTRHLKPKIITFRGKEYEIKGSTKQLEKYEMVEFVSAVIQDANELGIHVPSPEEAGYVK